MSKGRTIALNLYAEHVQVLDQLANTEGSRSAVVQRLLEEAKRRKTYQELDEAYQEHLKAGGERADHDLTEEMLPAASWPKEWLKGDKDGGRRTRRNNSKTR